MAATSSAGLHGPTRLRVVLCGYAAHGVPSPPPCMPPPVVGGPAAVILPSSSCALPEAACRTGSADRSGEGLPAGNLRKGAPASRGQGRAGRRPRLPCARLRPRPGRPSCWSAAQSCAESRVAAAPAPANCPYDRPIQSILRSTCQVSAVVLSSRDIARLLRVQQLSRVEDGQRLHALLWRRGPDGG